MAAGRQDPKQDPLRGWRVRFLIRAAGLNLLWEQIWPRLLPPLAICGLFVAVALLDLLPMLPFWLHIVALALFAGIFGYSLRGLMIGGYGVHENDARRRVETDSGIAHRPLAALDDTPIAFDGADRADGAETLWRLHLARMTALLARLRVGLPSPGMARRDPHALRAALVLILVIAGAAGAGDALARLERALVPQPGAVALAETNVDLWITPPAYTGLAPIFLESAKRKPTEKKVAAVKDGDTLPAEPIAPAPAVRVPVGSTFLAQMSHGDSVAVLQIGKRQAAFQALDAAVPEAGARVEGTFEAADAGVDGLSVSIGGRLAVSWPVRIEADKPPEVEFTQPPKNQGRGLLRVEFEARDDFGLAKVGMTIRNPEGWPVPGGDDKVSIGLPAPGLGTPLVKGTTSQDLTAHPWAGTAVQISLQADDAAGQHGKSDPVAIILPARTFNHPVARAIIAARKKLNRPTRQAALDAVADIENIAERPGHFFDDTVIFLTLVVARSRLLHDNTAESVGAVQKLLWDTALRIEDGEFAIADRDLQAAQKRLMEAMRNKADSKELNKLLDQLQKAMNEYMQALAEHLQREGLENMPQVPSTQMMESGDLQRMMDRIREMMRTGSIDAAKEMLAQLNRMLEAMRRGARMARQPRGMNKGRKMLKGLRDLSKRQQELLDRNFREMQRRLGRQGQQGKQGQQGQQGDPKAGRMAGDQEALRRALGKLMLQMDEMLGGIPPSMGKADRAMKGAGKSLGRGDRAGAVPQQTEALEQLRQATEGLAEQMARRMQGQMGMSLGRRGQQQQRGRDPFGRRQGDGTNGEIDDGAVKIPSRMELRRSREILDELRRRSGDHGRPKLELDYLDRLLRQF